MSRSKEEHKLYMRKYRAAKPEKEAIMQEQRNAYKRAHPEFNRKYYKKNKAKIQVSRKKRYWEKETTPEAKAAKRLRMREYRRRKKQER